MRHAFIALMVFAGCGSEMAPVADDASLPDASAPDTLIPEDPPQPIPTGPPSVVLISFNTALIDTIKGGAERLPLIIDAIKSSGADVICLEEVWNKYTTHQAMADAVRSAYPYAFWTDYSSNGPTGYGNGEMILSKYPLYRGRVHPYVAIAPTHSVDYMLIGADVLEPQQSYFHVMCTHTQTDLDDADVAIRGAEVDEIVAFAQTNGYLDGPTFLLGDFNMGPMTDSACTPTTTPSCPLPDLANYDKLRATFPDPNVGWLECTWCRDRAIPLQVFPRLFAADPDSRVDHCFARNLGASALRSVTTVFGEMQNIPFGSETLVSLSDHLGVRCTFAP
jgi:endonuclease/exonuclease/phosphatase family metal-dependent hydrolase